MPRDCQNVRIALAISRSPYHLYAEALNFAGNPAAIPTTDDLHGPPRPHAAGTQLTPAAKRALAEAEARRKAAEANARPMAKEYQGPKGPEPTRYGDWENKGLASDF